MLFKALSSHRSQGHPRKCPSRESGGAENPERAHPATTHSPEWVPKAVPVSHPLLGAEQGWRYGSKVSGFNALCLNIFVSFQFLKFRIVNGIVSLFIIGISNPHTSFLDILAH